MRIKKSSLLLSLIYAVLCIYILFFRTNDVLGNLEASFIWAAPMAVSHLLIHKKMNNLEKKNDNS